MNADCDMNHKRKRSKQSRAGCLMCKPNKLGKGMENKLGHCGFGKLRKEMAANHDLRSAGAGGRDVRGQSRGKVYFSQ